MEAAVGYGGSQEVEKTHGSDKSIVWRQLRSDYSRAPTLYSASHQALYVPVSTGCGRFGFVSRAIASSARVACSGGQDLVQTLKNAENDCIFVLIQIAIEIGTTFGQHYVREIHLADSDKVT